MTRRKAEGINPVSSEIAHHIFRKRTEEASPPHAFERGEIGETFIQGKDVRIYVYWTRKCKNFFQGIGQDTIPNENVNEDKSLPEVNPKGDDKD